MPASLRGPSDDQLQGAAQRPAHGARAAPEGRSSARTRPRPGGGARRGRRRRRRSRPRGRGHERVSRRRPRCTRGRRPASRPSVPPAGASLTGVALHEHVEPVGARRPVTVAAADHAHLGRAGRLERCDDRMRRAARAEHERPPACRLDLVGDGVAVGRRAVHAPVATTSVFTEPARAATSSSSSHSVEHGLLVRDRHVGAGEAARHEPAHRVVERAPATSGAARRPSRARAQRSPRSASSARASARPATPSRPTSVVVPSDLGHSTDPLRTSGVSRLRSVAAVAELADLAQEVVLARR